MTHITPHAEDAAVHTEALLEQSPTMLLVWIG
jgi:hypothetical protein